MFRRTEISPPSLRAMPFAEDAPDAELAWVDSISTPVRFPSGRIAIEEDAYGREAMLVVEGSFTVERQGVQIAELTPGDFMGEIALLAHQPRNATVTAAEDSLVYAFNRREFASLLSECPVLAARVLSDAVSRSVAA